MSGLEFEQLVFLYFKAIGYKPVKTPESKDGGVDMILTNKADGIKIAVQVKHRYKSGNQITVKEIRELDSAKKNHRCVSSWFITSSTFTNDALRQADVYRMKTSDINYVESKIIPWKEREAAKRQVAATKS
jgi:restriction system protein